VVPGARATGGVAIAPTGQLVGSECAPRAALLDVSAAPPEPISDDDLVSAPAAGSGGALAYVRGGRALVVRRGGATQQLGAPVPFGSVMSAPAFDAAESRVAVTITGGEPGLHVYQAQRFVPPARLTTGANDTRAQWLGEVVYFNRWQDERPWVHRVTLDGREPERALAMERIVVGAAHARGELLLSSNDETRLYWWNPTSGAQRPGPPALAGGLRETYHHALSPDGRWLMLQLGRQGHQLLRQRLDERGAAAGEPERVWTAPSGATMTDGTIGDDGRVIVAPLAWHGELVTR
jgi:hypothetical protein